MINEIKIEMPLEIRQKVIELADLMKKHFGVYPTTEQVAECVRRCVAVEPKETQQEMPRWAPPLQKSNN